FLRGVAEVVAPEARLRFEIELLAQRVVKVFFFAVNKSREPHTGLNVGAPAIEIEIPAGVAAAAVRAVEANDVEILVFDPDAACEASLAGFWKRGDVEHKAAHFTKKFTVNVVELVVLLIEAVGVEENHLQEAVRQILHREGEEVSDGRE